MNDEEKIAKENQETEEKMKRIDDLISTSGSCVISDFEKILGRKLTDEEKENMQNSLKAYFVMTTMMVKAFM